MSGGATTGFLRWSEGPSPAPKSLYEQDEYAWLEQQVAVLRAGLLDQIDHKSLAEYLSDMAASDRDAVESHLRVLLLHMLKIRHQPQMISGSWISSILAQQADASKKIGRSAGMRPYIPSLYAEAYRVARLQAAAETGIDQSVFEVVNPWTLAEALSYVPPSKAPHPAEPDRPRKPRRR